MRPPRRYLLPLCLALGIHGVLLFAFPEQAPYQPPEFGIEAAPQGVEVDLVAAVPAAVEAATAFEAPPAEPAPIAPPAPEPPPPAPEPTPPAPEPPSPAPEAEPPLSKAPSAATTPPPPAATPAPRRRAAAASRPGPPAHGGPGAADAPAGAAGEGGALTSRPGYLRNPHPAYPEAARRERQEGVVLLHIRIDERGQITSVRVATSSGFPLLDERALSTVRERWRFRPARRGQKAVAAELTLPIRFTLGR